jgi:hypothetical protein
MFRIDENLIALFRDEFFSAPTKAVQQGSIRLWAIPTAGACLKGEPFSHY